VVTFNFHISFSSQKWRQNVTFKVWWDL